MVKLFRSRDVAAEQRSGSAARPSLIRAAGAAIFHPILHGGPLPDSGRRANVDVGPIGRTGFDPEPHRVRRRLIQVGQVAVGPVSSAGKKLASASAGGMSRCARGGRGCRTRRPDPARHIATASPRRAPEGSGGDLVDRRLPVRGRSAGSRPPLSRRSRPWRPPPSSRRQAGVSRGTIRSARCPGFRVSSGSAAICSPSSPRPCVSSAPEHPLGRGHVRAGGLAFGIGGVVPVFAWCRLRSRDGPHLTRIKDPIA